MKFIEDKLCQSCDSSMVYRINNMKLTVKQKIYLASASAALLIVTILVGIAINQTFFSASGFVTQYLSALARHDAASALSMPGVGDKIPDSLDTTLLRGSGMGEITDIAITDVAGNDNRTVVTASYNLGGKPAQGEFVLTRRGNLYGIFENWVFAETPLARAEVTVLHDASFNMGNSRAIDMRSTPAGKDATLWGGTAQYLLFAPGNYVFYRDSEYVSAEDVTVNVATPKEQIDVTVDVQATQEFNEAVQKNVNAFLDECATQKVLQPSGCPFGYQTGNRIVGEPAWSVEKYPRINITPGETTWEAKDALALMRIRVDEQSLFDGTISPVDQTVEAKFSVQINFRADGTLGILLY